MNRAIIRCRCGHQVLSKEVLRTDLYERRSADTSVEYVCVRYRCRRCRRLGEAFVAEKLWDWSALEGENNELSETERDHFREIEPISESDMLAFHDELKTWTHLDDGAQSSASDTNEKTDISAPELKNNAVTPDASTRADEDAPRDNARPHSATPKSTPKTPEKPAPEAAHGDTPRAENP